MIMNCSCMMLVTVDGELILLICLLVEFGIIIEYCPIQWIFVLYLLLFPFSSFEDGLTPSVIPIEKK